MAQRHDIVLEAEISAFCDTELVCLNINDPASFGAAPGEGARHGLFRNAQV